MSITVTVNGQSGPTIAVQSGDQVGVSVGNSSSSYTVGVSPTGTPGGQGPTGPAGPPYTVVNVGSTTTLAAGANATVTATSANNGANLTLAFGIPAGAAGITPSLAIGNVTTLASGSSANVTLASSNGGQNVVLSFGIPAGPAGANGVTGVNNLTGNVSIAAGGNVTITPSGSTLTIAATGGLGGSDAIDGGDYTGELLYGITFTKQPQSVTANSTLTVGNWSNVAFPGNVTSAFLAGSQAQIGAASVVPSASSGVATFTATAATSANGSSWSSATTATTNVSFNGVQITSATATPGSMVWDGTRFVAFHDYTVFASQYPIDSRGLAFSVAADGTVAYIGTLPVNNCTGLVSNGSTYLTVEGSGGTAYRTTDLTNWASASIASSGTNIGQPYLGYYNGYFYVGGLGPPRIRRSADGYNWTTVYSGSRSVRHIAASPSAIVAASALGNDTSVALRSVDGVTWSEVQLPRGMFFVRWTGTRFVGTALGATYEYIHSADGLSWTVATLPRSEQWGRIAGSDTGWVLAGDTTVTATLSTSAAAANLTVAATAASGNPVSYQWQGSLDAGSSWSNVANATSSTLALANLTQADNGTRYRTLATATGASPAYSQTAILTVTG